MNPSPRSRYRLLLRACLAALPVSLVFPLAQNASAADGTWNVDASGNWNLSDTAPWLGNVVAEGSASTANFTNDISTATRVVTLTAPLTIGNIVFGDANTATAASWTLAASSTNTLTLAGAHTITVNALGTNALAAITAPIDGTDGLIKAGSGILSLSGVNTYSGGTTISAGTLRAGSSSALGATSGAVTVTSGAKLQLQNAITVANAINLNGSSALELTGGTPVLTGTVTLQSASTIAMGSTANASVDIQGNLVLGANTLTVSGSRPLTLSGAISGTGTLNLANISGTTIITGDNSATYSGQVNVARSTLAVGHDNALGTGTLLFGVNDQGSGIRSTGDDTTTRTIGNVVSLLGTTNSTYTYGSTTAAVNGNLTFSNTTAIALGSVTKKFQVYNRTQFNAGFTGTVGITMQTGTGTLVLNGANTYDGATTINAGTLLITGSKTGVGLVTVNSAGTLGGTGIIAGAATAASGSFLSAGASSGVAGTLTFSSTLDISGLAGGTGGLLFNLDGTGASDKIASGALTIGTGVLDLNDFSFTTLSGYGVGTYTLMDATSIVGTLGSSLTGTLGGLDAVLSISGNDLVLTVSAIPEPATYAMIAGAGLLGFALYRRRRDRT